MSLKNKIIQMNVEVDKIIDVKIDRITTKEALEKIKLFLLSNKQYHIVTLNPEMIVEAQKNVKFKNTINEADLVVPDGIGILWALDFLKCIIPPDKACPERESNGGGWGVEKNVKKLQVFISTLLKLLFDSKHRKNILKYRTHGIDLIYKICGLENIKNKRIFLLGAEEGIARETAKVLSERYDDLNIVGAEVGIRPEIFNFSAQGGPALGWQSTFNKLNDNLIQRINETKPNIILVAFGAPKQEVWIYENLKKLPSVKLAIGIGGSFDFISGKTKRAPLIFQRSGLEWLWRLIKEPKRIKRIYNATVRFGLMILRK